MKRTVMKTLALLSLSACILAGGAVSAFAAEGETEPCKHQWKAVVETRNECVETSFLHRLADGSTETLKLCPVDGEQDGKARLTRVKDVFSNFYGVTVYKGTLTNGMEAMTVAFYYPEMTEKRVCELCGLTETLSHSDSRIMASQVDASIEMPKEVVEGYDLMLVEPDGSEQKIEVSIGEKKAFFKLNVASGARLIHLVPKTNA